MKLPLTNKINKLNSVSNYFFKLKNKNYYINQKILVTIYKTFIRSYLVYGNAAICCVEKHLANKLETFQTKFLRFSLNIHCESTMITSEKVPT